MAALSNETYGKATVMASKDKDDTPQDAQPDTAKADAAAEPEVSSDPRERAEQAAAEAAKDDKD